MVIFRIYVPEKGQRVPYRKKNQTFLHISHLGKNSEITFDFQFIRVKSRFAPLCGGETAGTAEVVCQASPTTTLRRAMFSLLHDAALLDVHGTGGLFFCAEGRISDLSQLFSHTLLISFTVLGLNPAVAVVFSTPDLLRWGAERPQPIPNSRTNIRHETTKAAIDNSQRVLLRKKNPF